MSFARLCGTAAPGNAPDASPWECLRAKRRDRGMAARGSVDGSVIPGPGCNRKPWGAFIVARVMPVFPFAPAESGRNGSTLCCRRYNATWQRRAARERLLP